MKEKNFLKITIFSLLTMFVIVNAKAQTTIFTLDFESSGGYTTNISEDIDETNDYFGRIQYGVDTPNPTFTNLQDNYYFGAQDIDGITSSPNLPVTLSIDDINISGYTTLQLRVYLAEDDDGSNQDWDAPDYVHFSVDIDNSTTFTDVLNIEATGGTNTEPAIDTNFDGLGNGTKITDEFIQFTSDVISGTGSLMDILVEFKLDDGDTDIAIDHIEIIGIISSSNPIVSFNEATSSETETDVTFATAGIPITLTNYDTDVTITATVNGSSTAEPGDYTIDLTPLVFTANETLNIPLSINDDADFEDETIIIDFTVTSGTADLGTSTHTVTIIDNDTPPSIGFDAATSSETETDATFTSANIPISVTNYDGNQIDIDVAITGGTAEPSDYSYTTQSLSFSSDSSQNITIDINDDVDTDNETIIFTITETSAVTGLVISQATHTLTITDDETGLPSLLINEILADIPTGGLDANGDSIASTIQDEFIEIYNASGTNIDISGYIIQDAAGGGTTRHIFSNGTILPAGGVIVVFGGGTPIGIPSLTQVASTGTLALNNGGDTITILKNDGTTQVTQVTYSGNNDEAEARNEDFSGSFVDHSTISGNPVTFSPGRDNTDNTVFMNTWTGATDNSWTTSSNWIDEQIPSSLDNVIVPAELSNYPTVGTAISVNSIIIESGATLLPTNSVTGSVIYKRALTNASQWYLISSPVIGETYDLNWSISNSIPKSSLNTNNIGISTYDNTSLDTDNDAEGSDTATGNWRYLQSDNSNATTFNVSQGYGIIVSSPTTISFIGTGLYTTSQTISITQGASNSFNMVGNPFTAHLNLGNFFTDNPESTVLENSEAYFWNGSDYDTKTSALHASYEIAPGQGFFVEAAADTNLTFDIADVSHQPADLFQKNNRTEIHLFLTDGKNSKYANIYYIEGTTTGFDNGYDGKLFGGVEHTFALYSHLVTDSEGKKYQIQSLPNSEYENMIIPIGITAEANKEITFTAEALNLPSGIKVFLEDSFTNTFTRLDEANSEYKFTSDVALDGTGRFYLHSKSSILNIESLDLNNVSIYKTNNSNLRIVGLSEGKASIKLYNIIGKQVLNSSFTANGVQDITLPSLAKGIYIVQLETETGKLNKKITLE